jgi:signal transduction histidine kinase
VTNVVDFRKAAADRRHAAAALLAEPVPHTHAVQFYDDENFLAQTVGDFVSAGLRAGDRVIVIATEPHHIAFRGQIDAAAVDSALAEGRLLLLDARETLTRFMIGEMPDPDLFRDVISRLLSKAHDGAPPNASVRAYGEMVDLLWKDGNTNAAIRLEELWNDAGKEHSFSLLCAYVMGNFYKEGDFERFMQICRNHSHVIPTEKYAHTDDPHVRLREISLLQQRANSLENEIRHRIELEGALREALRERSRIEDELRASLRREKEARERAEASDAFKELFLGILGHDLRNPLNTILTSARLMTMRGEVQAGGAQRVDRLVASGLRMERMIAQLLDVTRARLADGIPVERGEERDLAAIVTKIVDEMKAAHPTRTIEVRAAPCKARIDSDRFEQVISNLVGNAIAHGDPKRPIRVDVEPRGPMASISVHNYGAAIDPELLPRLFDPFKRAVWRKGRADGLGLGLYIAERIVTAHGGNIEVESTSETGTRFEAIFARE